MTNGGRVTMERLNAALEDMCVLAEERARLMALARTKSTKISDKELLLARDLLLNVQGHDAVRGKFWLLEADLKKMPNTKLDNTGEWGRYFVLVWAVSEGRPSSRRQVHPTGAPAPGQNGGNQVPAIAHRDHLAERCSHPVTRGR